MLTSIIIGEKISTARKNKNISQAQLANQLSISSQAVGKWERGESMPDIVTFDNLANILGVDLNYFSESFGSAESEPIVLPEEKSTGWNMSAGNWKDADFSGLKNLHEKFNGSNIQNCRFVGSDLSRMTMKGNNIIGCDFSQSNLNASMFSGSNIQRNSFQNCNLNNSVFSGSHIDSCDFTNADFLGSNLKNGTFQKNIITNANWKHSEFHKTYFSAIIFEGSITDCSFENCRYSKVEFRNVTFRNTFFKNGNIKRIKFIDCKADNLTHAFLKNGNADLTGIELI